MLNDAEWSSVDPVKAIYQDLFNRFRNTVTPLIALNNLATGVGKTYQGLIEAASELIRAKQNGESLVIVYIAPQKGQIDINNHVSGSMHKAQALLRNNGIPWARVVSQTQLQDHYDPHCLYRDLTEKPDKAMRQLATRLDDFAPALTEQGPSQESDGPHIQRALGRIAQADNKVLSLERQPLDEDPDQAHLSGWQEELEKRHGVLFKLLKSAVTEVLSEASRDGRTLQEVLGHQDLVVPFKYLQRQLFPWYEVQRQGAYALGLVCLTSAKLMTTMDFAAPRKKDNLGNGDFVFKSMHLEDAVHGVEAVVSGAEGLFGLAKTRFLFMFDEADAIKAVFDQASESSGGHSSSRTYLRGMLMDQGRATQVGQTLLHEMDLVFRPAGEFEAIMKEFDRLAELYPSLRRAMDVTSVTRMRDGRDIEAHPAEARRALQNLRARYELDGAHLAFYHQQRLFRTRLLEVLEAQYNQHTVITGGPEEKLQRIREMMEAICEGRTWLNLTVSDPSIIDIGSTGAFTGGSYAFLNADERMDGVIVNPGRRTSGGAQIVSEAYLKQVAHDAGLHQTIISQDALDIAVFFELMLTIAFAAHELGSNDALSAKEQLAILRAPYRQVNDTSSAPLTNLLDKLSSKRVRQVMLSRREIGPDELLDDNLAFRTPQLIMQLIPDLEERYPAGEGAVSVVPSLAYRLWSAEHHLERLVSRDAYLKNTSVGVTFNDLASRPAHGAILISATGGFDASHIGGFCGDLLAQERYAGYLPMTNEALEWARQAREAREKVRPRPSVAMIPAREGMLSPEEGNFTARLMDTLAHSNIYKRCELRRMGDLITALSKAPGSLQGEGGLGSVLAHALRKKSSSDGTLKPISAMMMVQTLKNLRIGLASLNKLGAVQEIVPGHLYILPKRRGRLPVMIVAYDTLTNDTLKRYLHSDYKGAARSLADQLGKTATMPDDCLLKILMQCHEATQLLRTDFGCQLAIITTYGAAARGLNFKINRSDLSELKTSEPVEHDFDLMVLGMSPFYSAARPKFTPMLGPPDFRERAESETELDKRQKNNRRRFTSNNLATHYLSLTGMEVAARYNRNLLPGDEEEPPLKARNIRLTPDTYVPGFSGFLKQQHYIDLVRTIFQAIGRAERTRVSQHQCVILCSEIVEALLVADPLLYGLDKQGRSLSNRLHSASLNSLAVVEFARRHRDHLQYFPRSEEIDQAEWRQRQTLHTFSDDRRKTGWKNAMLAQIRLMNERALEGMRRDGEKWSTPADDVALLQRWDAFHHPDLLFEGTRYNYQDRLRKQGVPSDVIDGMWTPLPSGCVGLPVLVNNRGLPQEVMLYRPGVDAAVPVMTYPSTAQGARYKLPQSILATPAGNMGRYLVEHAKGELTPRWAQEEQVLHPVLQPDFDGIWGELAVDVWLEQVALDSACVSRLDPLPIAELAGIFEEFDRFYCLIDDAGERHLVAIDAKFYRESTDAWRGAELKRRAQQKLSRLKEWAALKGYREARAVYINARPFSQEVAKASRLGDPHLLAMNAYVRLSPTDANTPFGTPTDWDYDGLGARSIAINSSAAASFDAFLQESLT